MTARHFMRDTSKEMDWRRNEKEGLKGFVATLVAVALIVAIAASW